MKLLKRDIQPEIEKWLFRGKAVIVYGGRQVGKTTLVKSILTKYPNNSAYFDCQSLSTRQALIPDIFPLKRHFGSLRLAILDEAQKVTNIGEVIKLLVDHLPDLQIIATGSSSFELANQIGEPLTGRSLDFSLYPFSLKELRQIYSLVEIDQQLDHFMIYGFYPDVCLKKAPTARVFLDNFTSKYLYRDLLEFDRIKKSDILINLLQMLALQIGSEVSYNELSVNLGVDRLTVSRYIDLLQKAFVIIRLPAFSRNLRKEINKKQKIYFTDLGVRNSLIANFNQFNLRTDTGGLWENFCVVERYKHLSTVDQKRNRYFWRTHDQKEIDYIEEYNGQLAGFEFKYRQNKFTKPKEFLDTYPGSQITLVNRDNYDKFLGL